ncbi:Membrane attack complex component/perforin (MACPF) domain-containing protein [Dioscorea alata]|uniref:Membrane attack complex component/perforin (MACPF) domain-containing protein n=1 Tax=Dioscorea alata TaxID=55571 RepID=A0ACB7WDD3_DIOAL|nr:Membrane attack complex component/perforin (MACPF) domain-containing protein [Dioscorea alata]
MFLSRSGVIKGRGLGFALMFFLFIRFIEKYGTHIIVGVKMGGKDVIYIKQQQESPLQQTEVQTYLKRIADERFSDEFCENFLLASDNFPGKLKERGTTLLKSLRSSVVSHSKSDDIVTIHVRRGGINTNQSHKQWLPTISQTPNVISMSFVPITSLLNGVRGSGFLSHAVNLYLRYKPPIEELHHFLEFQLPRLWAPEFGELPLGPHHKKHSFPSLQFTLMGPKLYVNTVPVDSGNRPVTGLRLYLEGKKNNRLAIHLQHLASIPSIIQLSEETDTTTDDELCNQRDYYEPIKWTLLSHICTAPIQYSGSRIDDSASIVTKAWLEVKDIGVRKVLFLRLGFSNIASMKIRRSEWVGAGSITRKSGSISSLISSRFSASQTPTPTPKVEVNSAVFPGGPPVPIRVSKMSKFVDTLEMTRGPDDLPGYWVVTGAKLCVDSGKIYLKVKFSLLTAMPEEDM